MDGATVGFSSNGSKFAAILGNGTFVWNVPSRKLLKSLAVNCLASKFIVLSPDLDYIASPHDRNPHDLAVSGILSGVRLVGVGEDGVGGWGWWEWEGVGY